MTERFISFIEQENFDFDRAYSNESILEVDRMVKAAETINKSLRTLYESHGRSGFLLAISKKGGLPVKNLVIGDAEKINDLEDALVKVNVNASVLKANPNVKFSSEIFPSSKEGLGGLSTSEWIISVYGFENQKMNTAVALGIAFGAGLLNYQGAENLARDPHAHCVSEYMEHEFALADQFLK